LVDEAASKIKMEIDSLPFEIDQVQRKLLQLRIEEQALTRERDKASKARLEELRREVGELNEQRDACARSGCARKRSSSGCARTK